MMGSGAPMIESTNTSERLGSNCLPELLSCKNPRVVVKRRRLRATIIIKWWDEQEENLSRFIIII
jgi:hypothetical protein